MVPAMEQKFWQESWDTGRIGFNQGKPNELLVAHADKLGKPPKRTLVPLAGKAFDMRWLAERGHDVVGVEFVSEAIAAFFKDWGVTPTSHRLGAHEAQYAKGVTLLQADIFAVTPATVNQFDLIYDRAALVALQVKDRERYVANMRALLKPGGGIFLITYSYDQSKIDGPPWSADETMVRALYKGMTIEMLAARSEPSNPRMHASGVTTITETAYFIN